MTTRQRTTALIPLALFVAACDAVVAPPADVTPATVTALAPMTIQASGTFTQTAITSLVPTSAGPNTILQQTSTGVLSGTITGPWEDRLHVVIHPNDRFTTQFVITCSCTVDGKSGTLTFRAQDSGELVSPGVAAFEGNAVILDATGELSGMRGSLRIEGTVDVATGLATYDYEGTLRFTP
jgi:hypothetical protein